MADNCMFCGEPIEDEPHVCVKEDCVHRTCLGEEEVEAF